MLRLKMLRGAENIETSPHDFYSDVQYRCVVGSRAFGLETAASDTDLRGFYLPPARLHWSLGGVPEQLERGEECYWEAQKFVALALKANPNILEVLHSPIIQQASPLAQELLERRHIFLSQRVYQTYSGYVLSQMKRQEAAALSGKVRHKHTAHILRLLISGARLLQSGTLTLDVSDERERLLAVRRGEMPTPELERWHAQLQRQFAEAPQHTSLPKEPDTAAAEDWLLRARRTALEW